MSFPSVRLLDEIFKTISKHGIEKTCQILRDIRTDEFAFDNPDVNYIAQMVSKAFNISPKEIVYGAGRRNNRAVAIGFCTYYLHHYYDFSFRNISALMLKNINLIYVYYHRITHLNPGHEADKKFLAFKKQFDARMSELNKSFK